MSTKKGGHGFSAEVIERDINDLATVWLGTCKCGERWARPSYEAIEDEWRQHVHTLTGLVPRAFGNQEGRWSA